MRRRLARSARATARCGAPPRAHADEIERRYPKVLRRVGGYNLDAFVAGGSAVQPGEADGRLRRHARRRRRSEDRAGAAAEGQGGARDPVRRSAGGAGGDARDPRARAVGGRGDGRVHPRSHEAERRRSSGCGRRSSKAIRRRCSAWSSTAIARRICRRASRRSSAICGARRFGYRYHRAIEPAAQSAIWSLREAALGLSMAMKGDAKSLSFVEDTAVAPERLRDYIERFLADRPRPRHAGRRLRARVGRLPARAAGRQPEDRGRRPAVRGDRVGQRRSRARVRRRAVRRARRRPRPQPVHGEDVRAGPLRGVPGHQADVRSGRHLQSRQDRRRAAAHRQPALRPGLSHRAAGHVLRLRRSRRAAPARSRCAAASASAARRSTGRCARRTWRRATKRTRRAGARTCCGWRWPDGSARPGSATRACARCSISASSAAPARRSVRSASTSRDSRASSSPTTGRVTARRCARACSGHVHAMSRWGSRFAPLSNAVARSAPVRWLNERLLGTRPAAHAAGVGVDARSRGSSSAAARAALDGTTTRRALQRHVHELLQSGDRPGGR